MPSTILLGAQLEARWRVYALKYAERNARTRADSFILDDDHASPHEMDYYVWALCSGARTILVDTGYDAAEAARRGRPIERDPAAALQELGMPPESVDTVIVTHLHYDHAGGLDAFPNAVFHLQTAEMAFATGPCMLHGPLRAPFTADHVCAMVRKLFAGRVVFHEGDGQVAPGVTVHRIGGHSKGLQAVRVETEHGPLALASDAAHYYENFLAKKPFPIVVDVAEMMAGFDRLTALAGGEARRVVPGHDPMTRRLFARPENGPDWLRRLDPGPVEDPSARLQRSDGRG